MLQEKLIASACITGFFGDAGLQLITSFMGPRGMGTNGIGANGIGTNGIGGPSGWGLKPYFRQHGRGEALCIASGMMTLFYVFYVLVLRLPPTWYYLALYGIVLDFIFRKARLFTSLDGYYKALNYFWSAFWGAVPMVLPLVVAKYI